MPTTEDAVAAARDQPAYRSGVWAFRAMVLIAGVLVLNAALSFLPRWAELVLWLVASVAVLCGYLQFRRAGVSVYGNSTEVWSRRRLVYRDVFGLGRR